MPTSASKGTFEGVFVTSKTPASALTRSSSKRESSTAIETPSPAKRLRAGEGSSARSNGSRSAVVVASSSTRSTRQGGSSGKDGAVRRTPTRIAVPSRGDTSGPATDTRSAGSNSKIARSSTVYASENPPSSSEDELAIPVSSVSRSKRVDASTSHPSTKSVVTAATVVRSKKPTLPGHRTSSRKKAAISDLMNRKAPVAADDEPEASNAILDMPVAVRSASPIAHPSAKPSAGSSRQDKSAIEKQAESDIGEMEVDEAAANTSLSLGSTREASPEATNTSADPPVMVTPSKKGRPPKHLATPTLSAKKRTPTKAAKAVEMAVPDFLAPALLDNPAAADVSEGSSSIAAAVQALPHRHYSKSQVLDVLHEVLRRLSSPCQTMALDGAISPGDPSYRTWLTELPYLSEGHKAAEKDVRNTLHRTIREGEGNCLLLVGERGIGKTAIVDRSLQALEAGHGKDGFLVVRLSGLVQRDDKGALKEVARQLCSNAYVEEVDSEGATSFTSNANILSSLLAILEPGPSDDPVETASKAKPLIFIIDEFDLFAHHSVRQSFLYCLLDCIQGGFRRGGMAVLGLSARADCIETLEKRVKSRCQSRVHHLLPAEEVHTGLALTAKQAMVLPGNPNLATAEQDWNTSVEAFFSDKNVQMQLTCMDELRGLDADRRLFDIMFLLVLSVLAKVGSHSTEVSNGLFQLGSADLLPHIQLPERAIPADLSITEVAMLIASKHLVEEERPFNFVIAYERYSDHCKRAAAAGSSSTRAFGRGLCLKAFERLKKLGLVKDIAPGPKVSAGGSSIFRLCRLIPWSPAIEEAVKERKDIPQHLVKWCKAWSD